MNRNSSVGTLTDSDVKKLCSNGKLIRKNYRPENVEQACYELSASNVYYELTPEKKKYELHPDEYILVKPKQLVVVITDEELNIPNDMLGRILTKGRLFSVGLLPVNTYADPGFVGNLGIVFYNSSNNYLRLDQGDPIAKIEFSRLHQPVEIPYNGQHGYRTEIWPIPENIVLPREVARRDPRVRPLLDEIEFSYGPEIGNLSRRVFAYERRLLIAGCAYFILAAACLVLIGSLRENWLPTVSGIFIGVVSSAIFALLVHLSTNIRSR